MRLKSRGAGNLIHGRRQNTQTGFVTSWFCHIPLLSHPTFVTSHFGEDLRLLVEPKWNKPAVEENLRIGFILLEGGNFEREVTTIGFAFFELF